MTIESAIYAALTAGSPAPTDAAGRVYPLLMPKDTPAPAVTYQRILSAPVLSLDGVSGIDNVRVQIDCWAETYSEVKTLAAQVRVVMQDMGALPATDLDVYEEETKMYRVTMDFTVWQK